MKRPLSPHLPIYKVQITSLLSIFHRMAELFVFALGALAVFAGYWIILIPDGPCLQKIPLWIVAFCHFCLAFPIAYHSLSTLRYIFWDMGKGFECVEVTGWLSLFLSFLLALFSVMCI